MSVVVHPTKTFDYFNNIVDQDKARQLHSFCIARSIYHVYTLVSDHATIISVFVLNAGYVDC